MQVRGRWVEVREGRKGGHAQQMPEPLREGRDEEEKVQADTGLRLGRVGPGDPRTSEDKSSDMAGRSRHHI